MLPKSGVFKTTKPRRGKYSFSERQVAKIVYRLEALVERLTDPGLKIHQFSGEFGGSAPIYFIFYSSSDPALQLLRNWCYVQELCETRWS